MLLIIDAAFYAGILCYAGAALTTLRHLRSPNEEALGLGLRLSAAGAACLAVTFACRWQVFHRPPMTTMTDSLNLLIVFATVVMLCVLRKETARALMCFYVPPLAVLCLINAGVAYQHLHQEPRQLPGVPLMVHVGLVFLSYAMFFLASMTSGAYIFQTHRLKRHHASGLRHRLPSLEELDRTLSGLVGLGYPFFVATLILGMVWAWLERGLLGEHWWLAPKVLSSPLMVIFYALAFHARRSGHLRGVKLAYFVFVGFSSLLVVYVALALMNLRTYNFWGTPA